MKVDHFMPNIDWMEGGRHIKSENVYWTEIKASVPKECVLDCCLDLLEVLFSQ